MGWMGGIQFRVESAQSTFASVGVGCSVGEIGRDAHRIVTGHERVERWLDDVVLIGDRPLVVLHECSGILPGGNGLDVCGLDRLDDFFRAPLAIGQLALPDQFKANEVRIPQCTRDADT